MAGAPQERGCGRAFDPLNRESWLGQHPYLQPMAEVYALVGGALAEVDNPSAAIPAWDS